MLTPESTHRFQFNGSGGDDGSLGPFELPFSYITDGSFGKSTTPSHLPLTPAEILGIIPRGNEASLENESFQNRGKMLIASTTLFCRRSFFYPEGWPICYSVSP